MIFFEFYFFLIFLHRVLGELSKNHEHAFITLNFWKA